MPRVGGPATCPLNTDVDVVKSWLSGVWGGQYITRGESWLFVPVCVLAGDNFIETPMVMDLQNEEIPPKCKY